MNDILYPVVYKLLSVNKISFDKKELSFQIQSHPSYPSLHAITGVLDHFNIDNVAVQVPTNLETIRQLPDAFIAQINAGKGTKLVSVDKTKNNYNIFSDNYSRDEVLESEFLNIFTGIIVAVEKDEKESWERSSSLKQIILFSVLTFFIGLLLFSNDTSFLNILFIVLSILGIITSQSILKQELGEDTVIGNAFCSGASQKKDCNAVLSSKGSEILKNHKLSDASIIYFFGLLLTSLLINNFSFLYAISLLAFTIIPYSIYYQYRVVRSWCALCLSISAILLLQATLSLSQIKTFSALFDVSFKTIIITLISFISVYLLWSYVKPLVKEVVNLKKEKIEAVKFKRNFKLFNTLLQQSPKINTKIDDSQEIIFGNKDASLKIVVVTNPFCGHCKPVHKIINSILDKYKDLVKITIRLSVPVDQLESHGVIVATRLIELYREKGENECERAMNDIYGEMDFNSWISKWNKSTDFDKSIVSLKNQKEWCSKNAINFTPEILINGKSFPKEYKREDLLFFIEDLHENGHLKTKPKMGFEF